MESQRARGFGVVVLTYLAALALAIAVAAIMGRDAPILTVFVADCAATLLVFAASVAFANASLYDPYWSVAPPVIGLYWASALPGSLAVPARQWLVLLLVFGWGIRLTANWARGWPGLHHQDWRYDMLRESSSAPYWLVNLTGIHYFPTLIVFVGCLPLYAALAVGARPLGFLDGLAFAVTAGAIALEGIADEQLRAFNRSKQSGEICARCGAGRATRTTGRDGLLVGPWLFAWPPAGGTGARSVPRDHGDVRRGEHPDARAAQPRAPARLRRSRAAVPAGLRAGRARPDGFA
jgi:steroid 5-alpha reductase family enzyme